MDSLPVESSEFGSIANLKEQLTLFRECSSDHRFLLENQLVLQKLLSHTLNRDALFHDAVETLLAVAPFVHDQVDQSGWQRITWDALIGALNLRNGVLQAQIMNMLSRFHMLEGKHQLARENVNNALRRAQEENNEIALLWAYIRFFELLVYQPEDFSRTEVIKQVLALAYKIDQPHISIALHYALAHFYHRWGNYPQALGHGQMTYILARKWNDSQHLARAAYMLVTVCRVSLSKSAIHFLQVARTTDITQLPRHDYAAIKMHESALNLETGNLTAAAEGYSEAIKLFTELERPFHLASCFQSLALTQIRLAQFAEAQANLERAEELWQKCGSAYEFANFRFTQGYLEAWRGNKSFALVLLRDARQMTNAIPDMESRTQLRTCIEGFMGEVNQDRLNSSYRLA
jgi:hypothetical protein